MKSVKSQLVYSVEAGIVNATGYAMARGPEINTSYSSGSLFVTRSSDGYGFNHNTGGNTAQFNLDLSRSSTIYGNSNTVTPLSLANTFLIRY